MTDAAVITILPGRCIGAGNCVVEADRYFDQGDEDGLVVVLDDTAPASDRAMVERAASVCPVAAIVVSDSGATEE